MANAFGQTMPTNGAILEAIAHEQGLAGMFSNIYIYFLGFNSVAFLQDSAGGQNRGGISGRGHGYVAFVFLKIAEWLFGLW